ncbi:MAG: alkaline phosphatase family protein [Deltaproteobacteria bacterium]|nr:alkaline phosphatase family protein [Deltaproteobacteria bacterium]
MNPSLRPVLVLGLDGATFDVIRPLVAAGRLPNLARWMEDGHAAPLPSTVPPMTFPSWSSFLTGLTPGEHGMFDFTQKLPGRYRLRFTNATDRNGHSLYRRVSDAGGSVLALGMPATFPPEKINGLLVCGFDAPVSTGTDASSASDPSLYRSVASRTGPWMRPDLDEGAEGDEDAWHEHAIDVLLGRVRRKTDFALEALRQLRDASSLPALVNVIYSESDTVAHHFWRDHDPGSPRHDPTASAKRLGAVAAVYEALDAACGELHDAMGPGTACVIVSDHGTGGAGRNVVHLNRYLETCDLLARSGGGAAASRLARGARDTALRLLPPRVAQAVFRRVRPAAARLESAARFGGFDWRRTAAFSEEANTQPGVWLNLAGREEEGSIGAGDAERVRREVIDALLDWKLATGEPVVARARPREEVYRGPFVDRAPDIVVELGQDAGYGLSLVQTPWPTAPQAIRKLADDELAGGRGRGMNGVHRPEGVWIGPDELGAPAAMPRVAHALLLALGVASGNSVGGDTPALRAYSEEEDAIVAARLRKLGYLE